MQSSCNQVSSASFLLNRRQPLSDSSGRGCFRFWGSGAYRGAVNNAVTGAIFASGCHPVPTPGPTGWHPVFSIAKCSKILTLSALPAAVFRDKVALRRRPFLLLENRPGEKPPQSLGFGVSIGVSEWQQWDNPKEIQKKKTADFTTVFLLC